MKRISLISAVAAMVALAAAVGLLDAGPAAAANQPFTTAYDIGLSTTAPLSNPDVQIALKIDTGCAVPGCTNPPTNPFFDIAITTYSSKVAGSPGVAGPGAGLESGGNCAIVDATQPCLLAAADTTAYGAIVGTSFFQLNTNQGANAAAGNISTTTGSAPACGLPQTQLSQTFNILNGNIIQGQTVSGRDGADADTLPDTQADVVPAGGNGIYDGADRVPDYIVTLLGSSYALLQGRGFGVAVIIAGVAQTDVNFLTLNLTAFGQGYAAVTTLGNTDTAYEPEASQTSLTCTPFISTTNSFGTSVTNPGVFPAQVGISGVGGDRLRLLSGSTGDTINYAITLSAIEDTDDDGTPNNIDRCNTTAQGSYALAIADADGDSLGDTCDPVGGVDNVADGFVAPYPTDNQVCTAGQVGEGLPSKGRGEWHAACSATPASDQDIDGDGTHNFSDTCPAVFGRVQTDSDADGIGDVCDANLNSIHIGGAGAATTRDARSGGAQGLVAPNAFDTPACNVATTCHIPAYGVRDGNEGGGDVLINDRIVVGAAEGNTAFGFGASVAGADASPPVPYATTDSNDDGFPDAFAATGTLPAINDINSDSDADGCSDNFEAKGNCQGNPSDADVNNNGILDGAENLSPATGGADWRDDVAGSGINSPIAHSTLSSPNGQGSPDSDNDGCSNRRETLVDVKQGGSRDALNPYDVTDNFSANASNPSPKNKVVTLPDASAVAYYATINSAFPNTVSALNGMTWGGSGASLTTPGDSNNDGISNGAEYAVSANGAISRADTGGVLTLNDASVTANQAQAPNGSVNCSGS